MDDRATVQAIPVTPDAAETAIRAALRISARNGCALTRDAAEQIAEAILGCVAAPGETVTEWGVRSPSGYVTSLGSDEEAEKVARELAEDYEREGNTARSLAAP